MLPGKRAQVIRPAAGRENVGHVGHVAISFKLIANSAGRGKCRSCRPPFFI